LPINARIARRGIAQTQGISQAELAEYHTLRTQRDQLDADLKVRRDDLVKRIKDGASTEPGDFRAEVRSYLQQKLTAKSLEQVLGSAEVEALKSRVAPTYRNDLHVTLNPLW
jgi:hypothetical protein